MGSRVPDFIVHGFVLTFYRGSNCLNAPTPPTQVPISYVVKYLEGCFQFYRGSGVPPSQKLRFMYIHTYMFFERFCCDSGHATRFTKLLTLVNLLRKTASIYQTLEQQDLDNSIPSKKSDVSRVCLIE